MKTTILTSALLLSSTALGTVVPRAGRKVDYSGFKVLRVSSTDAVKGEISSAAAKLALKCSEIHDFEIPCTMEKAGIGMYSLLIQATMLDWKSGFELS